MVDQKKRLEYQAPSIEVIRFYTDEIMTTSMPDLGDDDGDWTGWY